MKRKTLSIFSASISILGAAGCSKGMRSVTLIQNAQVWTADDKQPNASILVIGSDGRFCYVGDDVRVARRLALPSKDIVVQNIDAHGARIIPGLIDSHLHLISGGLQLSRISLRDVPDRAAFIRAVAQRAHATPAHLWITGGRWSTESWADPAQPTKDWIDSVTPDNPVLLSRMDGHGALANSIALRLAGINKNGPPDPPGGAIERDLETKEPTGLLKDTAIDLVDKFIPQPSDEELHAGLISAMKHANANGHTCVHSMSSWRDIEVMRRARDRDKLTLQIRAFVQEDEWNKYLDRAKTFPSDDRLRVVGIKGYADGSLGSRTAYMTEPYSDNPPDKKDWRGLARPFIQHTNRSKTDPTRESQLHRLCCRASPLSIAVHCIGDDANSSVLGTYANVFGNQFGPTDQRTDWIPEMGQVRSDGKWREQPASMRIRIEHAQHIRPVDIPRFAKYGVIASMQPYHKADDGRYAESYIGAERCKTSYAFKSLLEAGAHLAFGSDWPVVSLNPFLGIHAAVTGRTLDGKVFQPQQNITVEDALRAYTTGAAYAAGDERMLGQIREGFAADFVVLDQDVLTMDPDRIKDVKPTDVFVAGRKVWPRQ